MGLKIVTGQGTTDHVTSADAGSMHAGIVGPGRYVFNQGNKFAYEVVSNNLVKIKDGDLLNQGRHMRIEPNDYEECTIENGLQSVKRNDLIVVRYSRNTETQIETSTVVVIKGVSGNTAVDPAYTTGNILNGDAVDDFPLYRVRLNGLNIDGVDKLFTVNKSLSDIDTSKVNYTDLLANMVDYQNTSVVGKSVDAMLEKELQSRVWKKIGKNLLQHNYSLAYDARYINATTNADKSIRFYGTYPGASFVFYAISTIYLNNGNYILSGCPSGGGQNTYYIRVTTPDHNIEISKDYSAGATFTVTTAGTYNVEVLIAQGITIDKVFYPQICYSDTTAPLVYEQYAPSNAEINSNLGKKVGCELALSSMHLTLVIDSMPSSSVWKDVPVSSDWGYGTDSIVLGIKVGDMQTPVINGAIYFEIATVAGVLSIMPRNSSLYGATYTMILARAN